MSMFPGPNAQVYYNEAGEPTGWDYPSDDPMDYYCDECGACHPGPCHIDDEDEDLRDYAEEAYNRQLMEDPDGF